MSKFEKTFKVHTGMRAGQSNRDICDDQLKVCSAECDKLPFPSDERIACNLKCMGELWDCIDKLHPH